MQRRLDQLQLELSDTKNKERHFKHKSQHYRLLLDAAGGNVAATEQIERDLTEGKDRLSAANVELKSVTQARDELKIELEAASQALVEIRKQENQLVQSHQSLLVEKDTTIVSLRKALDLANRQLGEAKILAASVSPPPVVAVAVASAPASASTSVSSSSPATVVEPKQAPLVTRRSSRARAPLLSEKEEVQLFGYVIVVFAMLAFAYLFS